MHRYSIGTPNISGDFWRKISNLLAKSICATKKTVTPVWDGCPLFTIIARTDKAPPQLISIDLNGQGKCIAIPVYEKDSEIVVKIKQFMAMYGIEDIKMRMLLVIELLKIQSFPADYYLAGGSTDQKKFIGNAVPPKVAQAIAESMYGGLKKYILNRLQSLIAA